MKSDPANVRPASVRPAPANDGPAASSGGRRDKTRGALLRAAEQLMALRSVDAVSIDEIVEAAGVGKGTFYNHFPDKESLQHDVLETIRFDIKKTIAHYNDQITDPARRIARAFCIVLRYALEHEQRAQFMVGTPMAFRLIEDKVNEGLIQDVGIGVSEGRFPIATTENGALLMLGIMQAALVRTLDHRDSFAVVARAQQLGAMLLRGLGLPLPEAEMIAAQEADHIICMPKYAPR